MPAAHTLAFDAAAEGDLPPLGGKCASLVRMFKGGAPVPPGFAVTTTAWRAMLAANGLAAEIDAALAGLVPGDVVAHVAASRRIGAAFAARPLPADVAAAIGRDYAALCRAAGRDGHDLPVAVRSSATAEDLPDASFAGQQDSYLWVVGLDAVLERVRDCWASLYSARAIGYRADRGIRDVEMAVGIQKMVDARAAGVAMTLDPLNGDRSRIVVDAAWGLGEAVVSGEVTPDHWVVDKVLRQIVVRRVATKVVEVVPDAAARCAVHRPVPAERRDAPCLTDRQVQAVAALARALEKQCGAPQDVEWAIEDAAGEPEGRLLLLQCRPETVWSRCPSAVPPAPAGLHGLVNQLLTPVRIRV